MPGWMLHEAVPECWERKAFCKSYYHVHCSHWHAGNDSKRRVAQALPSSFSQRMSAPEACSSVASVWTAAPSLHHEVVCIADRGRGHQETSPKPSANVVYAALST